MFCLFAIFSGVFAKGWVWGGDEDLVGVLWGGEEDFEGGEGDFWFGGEEERDGIAAGEPSAKNSFSPL